MLASLFDNPIWQRWVLTLIHFLWQGTAVVVLLAVALRVLRIRTAAGRYAAHLAALGLLVICPLITFALVEPLSPSQPSILTVIHADHIDPAIDPVASLPSMIPGTSEDPLQATPVPSHLIDSTLTSDVVTSPRAALPETPSTLITLIAPLQPWIAGLWVAGVLCLSLRLMLGFAALHRIRAGRSLPTLAVIKSTQRLACALSLAHPPAIFACDRIDEPAATGLWRPMILMPASWLSRMPMEMIEAIIAHELAHIRRHDLWVNLLQRIVEAVFFFHPATWWLSNRIRIEREICCDELAVAVTRQRMAYVHTLEFVARERLARVRPALAVHIGGARMALLQRVRHVLGLQSSPAPASTRAWLGGVAALAVPVILAGSSLLIAPAVTDSQRSAMAQEERRDDRPREGDREEERPREGDRPREGVREVERPRGGDREKVREGDRERTGPLREPDRPRVDEARIREANARVAQAEVMAAELRKKLAEAEHVAANVDQDDERSAGIAQAVVRRRRAELADAEVHLARERELRTRLVVPQREGDRERVREGDRETRTEVERESRRAGTAAEKGAAVPADTPWIKVHVDTLEKVLAQAEAEVAIAERGLARVQAQHREGVAREAEVDRAQRTLNMARARAMEMKANLAHQRAILARTEGAHREGRPGLDPGPRGDIRGGGERRVETTERPPVPRGDHEEMMRTINELRAEVERLRREVAQMREQREARPGPDRPAPRAGDRAPDRPAPREGDREAERDR